MIIIYLLLLIFLNGTNASSAPYSNVNIGAQTHTINSLIESFRKDLHEIQSLPPSKLTTASSTCVWTLQNWKACSTHSLARYIHHFRKLPESTTARYILPTMAVSAIWSALISLASHHIPLHNRIGISTAKFSVILAFFQAPLLLLLALRANRALDRLLEARRAWADIARSARTLMGLISCYILPTQPQIALLMGRYLAIFGWALKGVLKDESDDALIQVVMGGSYPREVEWIMARRGEDDRCPTVVLSRLRYLLSIVGEEDNDPVNVGGGGGGRRSSAPIRIRMEEILHDIEKAVATCNRILMSPTPPIYTSHTSRVLVMYLVTLPLALVSIGASTMTVMCASVFSSYVLVGIDEIGCIIENPFPVIPMYTMAETVQNVVEQQVAMMHSMPVL